MARVNLPVITTTGWSSFEPIALRYYWISSFKKFSKTFDIYNDRVERTISQQKQTAVLGMNITALQAENLMIAVH